jgi:hypothetical protein
MYIFVRGRPDMHRRHFVLGSLALLSMRGVSYAVAQPGQQGDTSANVRKTEDDFDTYEEYLEYQYPLPKVTAIIPFKVTLDLRRGAVPALKWHPRQTARIQRAGLLFQTVWSSKEFKDKVTSLKKPLIWHEPDDNADDESKKKSPPSITGPELYDKLVSVQTITMPLTIVFTLSALPVWGESANSGPDPDYTHIQWSYLSKASPYDLCNTLSHEYTHYAAPGASWDGGHSDDLKTYVSYGIGGLTEYLASDSTLSDDVPV